MWSISSRSQPNKPYIKVYEEERELTVLLLIDVSGSGNFGAVGSIKRDYIAEVAATLAFSADQNNDKIGVILFSDKVEKFIPPKKGRKHVLLIIRELLDYQPQNNGTDIEFALKFMTDAIKKRCTTFMISDFIDLHDYTKAMTIAGKKHDLTAIQVYDKRDAEMPNVGLVKLFDAETQSEKWVNTSSSKVRKLYSKWWYERQLIMNERMTKCNVDFTSVATDEDYVKALMALFKRRGVH